MIHRLNDLLARLVPASVWRRIEEYARWRRIDARVSTDIVEQVKAQKAARAALRDAYAHDPRLGVIATSFNQVWNVSALADSLLANPHVSELVVCEDGSIDGSLDAWVSRLIGPNHLLIRSNDLHEIRSLDRAFRLCRAEILCVIQDDDVVPEDPSWAATVLALFDAHPRLGVVGGFRAYREAPGLEGDPAEPSLAFLRSRLDDAGSFRFVPTVSIGPYWVRAACYAELGGFDTAYSAPGQAGVGFDEEFGLRAWIRGWQVGYLHQPFKTGVEGEYHYGSGGTFLYGEASERTEHDIANKRRMAATYAPHHDTIMTAVRAANAGIV
jgi:hypothetical protein